MIQLYEFTVLRFYRLFLLTLQYIDTLRLYAFTILRLYRLLLFTLCINLPLYGVTLVSFASTPPLRFYAFTSFLPFPAHALHTEHEFTNLRLDRFHAVNLVNR